MNSRRCVVLIALAAIFTLSSCSGVKNKCTNCNVPGKANVTLTLTDTPPTGALFLNFNLPISAISLTPSGGGADIPLLSTPTTYEMTHLQSDSAIVGTAQVTTGTYTSLNVFVTNSPSSVFFNGSANALGSCAALTICNLSGGAPGKIAIDLTKVFGGSGLVLTDNENLGIDVDFSLNNAITTTNGITLDLTQANVLTASALPRTNQNPGTLDTIQGVTGTVTAVTASSLTVKSPSKGSFLFGLSSTTVYTEVPALPQCNGAPSQSCIQVGSVVSVDADVAPNGTLPASVVDIIDVKGGVDEVEGVIYPTATAGVFGMIVSDTAVPTGNTTLTALGPGSAIYFTMSSSPTPLFTIDVKNLPVPSSAGFAGSGDLQSGQQVRLQVASVGTFKNLPEVTASTAVLRFGTINGAVGVNTPTSTAFTLDNASLNPFYGNFLTQVQVQAYSPQTIVDNVSGISNLTAGNSVSISTLFLNNVTPPFQITKVRKH